MISAASRRLAVLMVMYLNRLGALYSEYRRSRVYRPSPSRAVWLTKEQAGMLVDPCEAPHLRSFEHLVLALCRPVWGPSTAALVRGGPREGVR